MVAENDYFVKMNPDTGLDWTMDFLNSGILNTAENYFVSRSQKQQMSSLRRELNDLSEIGRRSDSLVLHMKTGAALREKQFNVWKDTCCKTILQGMLRSQQE